MHTVPHYKRQLSELYSDKFFLLGEITFTNLSYFSMKLKKNHFVLIYILDSMRKRKENYIGIALKTKGKVDW